MSLGDNLGISDCGKCTWRLIPFQGLFHMFIVTVDEFLGQESFLRGEGEGDVVAISRARCFATIFVI